MRGMDLRIRIRIRIHTKMSRIRNTACMINYCPCSISYSAALKSVITFLNGRVALSSFANLSFFVLDAVIPFSSSLATQRCRNVQRRADPAGYRTFPMKQRCRKLDMAFSRVSIPDMNTRCSSMRSKTILLKHTKKGSVSFKWKIKQFKYFNQPTDPHHLAANTNHILCQCQVWTWSVFSLLLCL